MGTKPEQQQKGFGKATIQHTFEFANKNKLPCYLETATEKSLSIHKHAGYEVVSEFILPTTDIKLWALLRPRDKA